MPTWRRRVALDEYKRRRQDLEQRLQAIAGQVRQHEANVERHEELAGMVKSIEALCQRVKQGLAEATFEQKRMTHTVTGSLLARGAFRGGKSVI